MVDVPLLLDVPRFSTISRSFIQLRTPACGLATAAQHGSARTCCYADAALRSAPWIRDIFARSCFVHALRMVEELCIYALTKVDIPSSAACGVHPLPPRDSILRSAVWLERALFASRLRYRHTAVLLARRTPFAHAFSCGWLTHLYLTRSHGYGSRTPPRVPTVCYRGLFVAHLTIPPRDIHYRRGEHLRLPTSLVRFHSLFLLAQARRTAASAPPSLDDTPRRYAFYLLAVYLVPPAHRFCSAPAHGSS